MAAVLDREEFKRLYIEEGQTISAIAASFGISRERVRRQMDSWGIALLRNNQGIGHGRPPLSYDLLKSLYVDRGMTPAEIADELGYDKKTVARALRSHQFVIDYYESLINQLRAGELWFLHCEQRLSIKAIAHRFATSVPSVKRRLTEVDIPITLPRSSRTVLERPHNIPPADEALLCRLDAEVAARSRQLKPNPVDELSAKDLRRLHHDEQLSFREIATRYGTTCDRVTRRARELGVEIRLRRKRSRRLDDDEIKRRDALCQDGDIKSLLGKYRIDAEYDPENTPLDLTEPLLRDLYEKCLLTLDEVGLLCIRSDGSVHMALRRFNIDVRPASLPQPTKKPQERLTRARLAEQLTQQKSLDQVAEHFGYASVTSLKIVARALQVPLEPKSPQDVPEHVMNELREAGIDQVHINAILDPRRRGRGSCADIPPWKGVPSVALMSYLMNDLELNKAEIIERFHLTVDTERQAFSRAEISVKKPTTTSRSRAWTFDIDELWRMTNEGMTGMDMAEHFGVSWTTMFRTLHRHHFPVRVGGRGGEMRVRYDELVSNHGILDALRKAGVALAGVNPPNREALPAGLMHELRDRFHLSYFDIELLTGRTMEAVKRDMGRVIDIRDSAVLDLNVEEARERTG